MLANSSAIRALHAGFDWQILAFTAAISLLTGLLFGILPAWQATRTNRHRTQIPPRHHTSSRSPSLGKGLVVFQIALSTILLIGAALFVRTLINLNNTRSASAPTTCSSSASTHPAHATPTPA
jgi:hypothetical protein